MKRKIMGAEFIAVFNEFGDLLGRKLGMKLKFLVQGTNPNKIESRPRPHSDESTAKENFSRGVTPT